MNARRFVLVVLVAIALPTRALAVGLDGPASAPTRLGVGLSFGVDQVASFGGDSYRFAELFLHAEARVSEWLVIGGAVSARADVDDFSYALADWHERGSTGLVAQAFVGYDGTGFHLSAGSWFYGDSRHGDPFAVGLLPYGVLRLRFGSLDGWHVKLRIADGAPFTAEAGAAVRLLLGIPPAGAHRWAVGGYYTLGEGTAGIVVTDEFALGDLALRAGALLGAAHDHGLARPEISVFLGPIF